ncbi:sugar phosphate isomerase/epimerase family protein [Novipirellula artificiosorum]|uniref:Inosose isomerase n=1 Tax=Novipirellula artificiosorum TaxID=2528016 RepID=A0A5C6E1V3_9BACT|nr:sugar phosphate isomerase/epimerase family protein [Novipirellula artificiosorum]TWU42464.1 Inosose isomerase [Novipirellula artificiosorum]
MNRHDRRRFFQHVMALGGVAAASSQAFAKDASSGTRKYTMDLNGGGIGVNVGVEESIALASKYGFESVGISSGTLAKLSEDEIAQLKEKRQQAGLVWGASGLAVDFRRSREKFEADLKSLPAHAKALQSAGVTRVSTWLTPSSDQLTYNKNFGQHAERLRRVATVLQDHGVRFGLEYVGPRTSRMKTRYSFIHTLAETQELIAAIDVPNMGVVLDSWHWYTAEETIDDLMTLSNDDVVACDLNDAPSGLGIDEQQDASRELPAATGVIDIAAFLRALVAIGYDGPVRAEPFNKTLNAMDNDAAVKTTAAAMKKAFAKANVGRSRS